ncbi:MAG: DUF2807 domain-containing protein [Muribaculaceae bacterium]|nr:DUF2807 domain-containing protein [Muribaculaceae bacterium]
MKKFIIPLAILTICITASVVSLAAYAGARKSTDIDSPATSRTITVGNFDEIDAHIVDVEVSVGAATGTARLEAPEDLMKRIEVSCKHGVLKVRIPEVSNTKGIKGKAKLYVSAPFVEEVDACVGSKVSFDKEFTVTGDVELDASTGASIYMPGITTDGKCELSTSTAGNIHIVKLTAGKLECDASTGSGIKVDGGTAASASLEASTGAGINCPGLVAQRGKAEASTGSGIICNFATAVKLEQSTGGSITNAHK